jgi:cytoskeleton protein RodZ
MSQDDDRATSMLERKSAEATPSFVSPSVGAKLRAARQERGLTVGDIAKALKLSASQVEALEADDWRHLPGSNTIVRGFVRNYAHFLDMETSALMNLLDTLHIHEARELEIPEGMNVGVSSDKKARLRDSLRIIAGLAVLIASILLYFLLPDSAWQSMLSSLRSALPSGMLRKTPEAENRKILALPAPIASDSDAQAQAMPVALSPQPLPQKPSPTQIVPKPSQVKAAPASEVKSSEKPSERLPEKPPETPSPALLTAPPANMAQDSVVAPIAPARDSPPAPPLPAPAISGGGLTLRFLEGAWVEVRNRNGIVVFSRMNPGGTEQQIEIQPPFSLIIGNAVHVRAYYKGKPLDLSGRSRENVARLTVR